MYTAVQWKSGAPRIISIKILIDICIFTSICVPTKIVVFPKNGIHCLMFEKQTIGSYVFFFITISPSIILLIIAIIS